MLSVACCDPVIQATAAAVAGGDDYAGSPILKGHLAVDYANPENWSYDPATNLCSWTAPTGSQYLLDSGAPANVAPSFSVDAAHYGGGCTQGGAPVTQAATGPSTGGLVLLVGVGVAILYYLVK